MSIENCPKCNMNIDTDVNTDHEADCVFTITPQDEDDLADYNNLPADEK